jgi:hypothetical protein
MGKHVDASVGKVGGERNYVPGFRGIEFKYRFACSLSIATACLHPSTNPRVVRCWLDN